MSEHEQYLTTEQLGKLIHRQPQTLRLWRASGQGPRYIRTGGLRSPVLYRLADVEAWLEAHAFQHTAEEQQRHAG